MIYQCKYKEFDELDTYRKYILSLLVVIKQNKLFYIVARNADGHLSKIREQSKYFSFF